jgi:hypothetical protein
VKAVSKTGCAALIVTQVVSCVVACYSGTTLQERELNQHDGWWSMEIKYPIIEDDSTFNAAET